MSLAPPTEDTASEPKRPVPEEVRRRVRLQVDPVLVAVALGLLGPMALPRDPTD